MPNCNLLICIVCKKLTNKKGKNNIVENYIYYVKLKFL